MRIVAVMLCGFLVALGTDPDDSRSTQASQDHKPAIVISIESWLSGKAEYEFDADGTIRFRLDLKRPESHVTGHGKMSVKEIDRFIKGLDQEGFFKISAESIQQQVRESGGRVSRRTDQRTYTIWVRHGKHRNRISYYNVHGDAKQFPQATHLQALRECVRRVEWLLSSTVQYTLMRRSAYEHDAPRKNGKPMEDSEADPDLDPFRGDSP